MQEQSGSIFTSEFDDVQPVKRRWFILPIWIRAFAWFFLLTGAMSPFMLLAGLFGVKISLNLYGLESTSMVSVVGVALISLFMLKGIAAYGLWAEKNWGIVIAMADGVLGIVIRIVSMVFIEDSTNVFTFYFRPDLVLLVIYLVKLYRIKNQWDKSSGK